MAGMAQDALGQPQRIVVEDLPDRVELGWHIVQNLGRFGLIMALVSVSASVSTMLSNQLPMRRPVVLFAGVGVPVAIYVVLTFLFHVRSRRVSLAHRPSDQRPWTARIHAAIGRDEVRFMPGASDRAWRPLIDVAPRPIAVVDSRVAPDLPPAQSNLLEPEAVMPSEGGLLVGAAIFLVLGVVSLFGSGPSRWWNILVFFALVAYFLSRHPRVRQAVPALRGVGRIIAGPGWVRVGSRPLLWTVEDSILLVLCKGGASGPSAVFARLVGPSGVQDITFASARDPDFLLLWERWTTTAPRLELAGSTG